MCTISTRLLERTDDKTLPCLSETYYGQCGDCCGKQQGEGKGAGGGGGGEKGGGGGEGEEEERGFCGTGVWALAC